MIDPIADPNALHAQILEVMAGDAAPSPKVFDRAHELGVFPAVRAWFESRGEDVSDSDARSRDHRIAHVVRRQALTEILEVLEPPFAVLKGIPLGRELYGDSSLRQSGDIDLLVPEECVESTAARLTSLGYEAHHLVDSDANRELELVHSGMGLLIDLHWRIAFPWVPAPSTTRLLSDVTSLRTDGMSVPVLSRSDRLIQLLLHFHDHVGFAKGLLDIAAFLDVHGHDVVDEALPTLESLGLLGVASWPLAVFRVLDISGPRPPRTGATVDLWARWTAGGLRDVLQGDEPIGARHSASFKIGEITQGEQVALKAATMALLDRRRDRLVAMARPVVLSPGAIARRNGRESPSPGDWARWAVRPARLVMRQIQQLRDE